MNNHISGRRKDAAQEKIQKKIDVLEKYAASGVPADALVPKDMTAFRQWEDASIGLEKIGSPNTMDKPFNRGAKKRALELIEILAKKKNRKERRTQIIDTLRAQVKKLDRLVGELTNQMHATRHDLDEARQGERRWKKRCNELSEENAELRKQLSTVTSLRSVASKAGRDRA
jgi:septal ring factor EnvC (AmiA/AmiB activator)